MKLFPSLAWLTAVAALLFSAHAEAQQRAQFESLVATHARANNVPEALVHRVIVRESRYRPELVGRGGTIGLMQIKLATARGLGYTGDAAGLRDPDTNLTYGVKYLAGAWRAANSDHARAVRYYAGGYYYVAKRQRQARTRLPVPVLASAPPTEAVKPAEAASEKALLAPK
jgi:soluble lytic murein transglycosylase-like protein